MLCPGTPKILQFIPFRRPAVMARMLDVDGLPAPHACGVLDLEDGHWQVGRPQATAAARQEAREGLLSLDSFLAERADRPQLALRVNPIQSSDFGRDLPVV